MYPAYLQMVKGPGMGFGGNSAEMPIPDDEAQRQRYEELWAVGGAGFLAAWGNLLTGLGGQRPGRRLRAGQDRRDGRATRRWPRT